MLYAEGFTIINQDGSEYNYKLYIRSSSKSRNGECLFTKEELHEAMTLWNRMGIELEEGVDIDLASLQGYESLNSSGIIDTIEINPDNILMIEDYKSVFNHMADVVTLDDNGDLTNNYEETEISNNIFDVQSLLDSSFFPNNKGMMLLRNHMYKLANLNTNIEEYYRDQAEKSGKDNDTWVIQDMFGNDMKVSEIKMISSPNSLKTLKFSYLIGDGSEKSMFQYWKKAI